MRVTAIVHPATSPSEPTVTSPREFDAVDEFVASLSAALGEPVAVLEAEPAGAPTDGYLVVFGDTDLSAYGPACSRIVVLNADRATVAKKVETFGLAAAIEKQRYFQWKRQRADENGSGVIGLKELAPAISATIKNGPYTTANYGWLSSPSASDLPSLLAAYLKAHEGRLVR